MTKYADLHIHTYYSDGTDSPNEVVDQSVKFGLSCIAITDHDTLEGIRPTREAAKDKNLEVISGIELSTEIHKKDIHVLGYLVDEDHKELNRTLDSAQQTRVDRIKEMLNKLKELGIDNIELDEVCQLTQSKSVGRPHLATLLVKKGWVSTIKQAFDKYLAEGAPAYVPKYKLDPFKGIELIKKAGGVAVLAHPMVTNKDEIIPQLVEAGLGGIEVYYPNCSQSTISYYQGIADKHGLVATGGSDAHGKAKTNTYIGKATIPYECIEQLKERANGR